MQYREYGKTGKMVSVLGFGTSRFSREDYATEAGQEKIVNLLVRAWELGINVFDTWYQYGDGRCEELLGRAIKKMSGSVYVSNKSGECTASADELRRGIDISLKRMDIGKIHFYHMWRILSIEQFRHFTRNGGPYEGAIQAQKEGLIDHICFSAHCDGDEIAEIAAGGYFEGVILSYNIINFKYREKGLLAAKKNRLGVVIMNPLGGGIIPRNAQAFSFAVREDEDISDVALKFCASHSAASLVLSGMTTEQELEKNVAALEGLADFSVQRKEEIKSGLTEVFNTLCNGCRYCNCPAGLEPHNLMLAYNEYMLCDYAPRALFVELGNVYGYGRFPVKAFACTGCGACERQCSQHLPIRKRIAEITTLIEQRSSYLHQGLVHCFGEQNDCRVGVYGCGSYASDMLFEYEAFYGRMKADIVMFDADPAKVGKVFSPYGFPIHHPDDIGTMKLDKLIIATDKYYNEIYDKLRKHEEHGVEIVRFPLAKLYVKLVRDPC